MAEIRYDGTAPGQAEEIKISGKVYRRGETYQETKKEARELVRRGGFKVLTNPNQAADVASEKEA